MQHFECGCGSRDHLIRAECYDGEEGGNIVSLYFVTRIGPCNFVSAYKRVWAGIKIMFGCLVKMENDWSVPEKDPQLRELGEFILRNCKEADDA